jgi:hypothetical protein
MKVLESRVTINILLVMVGDRGIGLLMNYIEEQYLFQLKIIISMLYLQVVLVHILLQHKR